MKKIVLLLMALVGTLTVQASGYDYLTFETTDGAKASVPVSSLTLTIKGTTLTVGSKSFTLSNLSKMYFSTTDESITTGISTVDGGQSIMESATEIYDFSGKKIERSKATSGKLPRGAYIVKAKDKTYKIVVR